MPSTHQPDGSILRTQALGQPGPIAINFDGKLLKPKMASDTIELLTGEFCNEVLDQELREAVAQETEAVRNLLLAQAFSATSLLDEMGDTGDYRADCLAIRRAEAGQERPPGGSPG